ncbi:MAG: hypothetical protein ACOYJC_11695 [Christensenellales bacterium]|jgi:hypothetical protein
MWIIFKKDGKIHEVQFSGKVNDAIEIDKVLIDGVESFEEIDGLEDMVIDAYFGL